MEEGSNVASERIVYFDYLRVFAILAVVVLHVAAQNFDHTDINGMAWQVFNVFDGIVRWGVPVFVMISGALFLGKDIPIKKLYSKYILRMAVAFVFWSVFYAIFVEGGRLSKLVVAIRGYYHLWFILMIIGLYICTPLIRPIVASVSRVKYYLLMALIFAFTLPWLFTLIKDFRGGGRIEIITDAFKHLVSNMGMQMVLGFAAYFVLGYFLNKAELSKRQRVVIYILGLVGFAATVVLNMLLTAKTQAPGKHYLDSFTLNVLFEAVAVFTLFKYGKFKRNKLNTFVRELSKYSFGAYLVHAFLLDIVLDRWLGINTLSYNPVLSVILISITVYVVSFGVSAVLNQIPVLNKYIV